jgi:UDP-N-acetylmuramoyl-L-alanine---L-glutamate ligase
MHIKELSGQRVAILGYGREGQATVRALQSYARGCDITLLDRNPDLRPGDYPARTGPDYLSHLDPFDVIVKSPGIPPCPELEAVRGKLVSSTQIFFDSIRNTGALVIGVTGSKGKSTTSSLIYEILKADDRTTYLVGNIGKPALDYLPCAVADTLFVQELSSYQLMDLTTSPRVAVVTAFFPEHLDYHGSLEAYRNAKAQITRFQAAEDVAFYNGRSPGALEIARAGEGRLIPFTAEDAPLPIGETRLRGSHNASNIAAAYKVCTYLGVGRETCLSVFRRFQGLPHRLQSLGVHHEIEWIDDAISTTPESTVAALDAVGERVCTVILGGQDRGFDFRVLGERIAASAVRHVILFPDTGPRIRAAIEGALAADGERPAAPAFHEAPDMATAVRTARERTTPGSVCLLSTASPSYNMFRDFEAKGSEFQRCVREL